MVVWRCTICVRVDLRGRGMRKAVQGGGRRAERGGPVGDDGFAGCGNR